jgi:class III poly(R)-hydroxyalkanoic acid synthase PhaE subunit
MSDKKSPQDFMNDWQALQKQYWSAWTDATKQSMGQPPAAGTPWHEGLEQWSRMFADSGKQSETAERLMGSAKNYVALMQSMVSAATGKNIGADPMQAWSEALRNGFNMPGIDPSMFNNPMAGMLQGIRGEGARGFTELSQGFAPFLAQARQEGMSWLQAPAFGYAREHQEHYQKMMAAFVEYQEAMKQYNALILKSSARSFEIFEGKLAERAEPGRQIDSLRGLYDVWVDAAEEAYAEIALSEEFRKVYGDVVNTQMRVRSQIQAEVERVGVDLGMPTRTELNSVHKRLHEMRRASLECNCAELKKEVDHLRTEVRKLRVELDGHDYEPQSTGIEKAKPDTAPKRKRAAAVAKPRAVSKQASASFNEALGAMRSTTVAAAPKKSAKAVASVRGKRAVRSAKAPGRKA